MNIPTVLYAEHDSQQRARLSQELQNSGFAVRAVKCAVDALQIANAKTFDVIIVDYELPDMTGAQLAQEIRGFDPAPQIVLLSKPLHLPASERAYVDFHAIKGLPLDGLVEIVENLLGSPLGRGCVGVNPHSTISHSSLKASIKSSRAARFAGRYPNTGRRH